MLRSGLSKTLSIQRIGILGGTFDPIHYGHLAIAEEARWALALERVYLVPAARQPLKPDAHEAGPVQRLEMVRLACLGNPHLLPSDLELQRDPPSYTVDTLDAFRAQLGAPCELFFILGGDALRDLPRWHKAAQILHLARLAVVTRPGIAVDLPALEQALPGITARTTLIEGPNLDISSTMLRRRLAAGRPVRYQVPDVVLEYMTALGLYGPGGDHPRV